MSVTFDYSRKKKRNTHIHTHTNMSRKPLQNYNRIYLVFFYDIKFYYTLRAHAVSLTI